MALQCKIFGSSISQRKRLIEANFNCQFRSRRESFAGVVDSSNGEWNAFVRSLPIDRFRSWPWATVSDVGSEWIKLTTEFASKTKTVRHVVNLVEAFVDAQLCDRHRAWNHHELILDGSLLDRFAFIEHRSSCPLCGADTGPSRSLSIGSQEAVL